MISQRTSMGMAARAMDGKWPNGAPPLGYDACPDGRLRIDKSEAEIVRWIFARYLETQSMAAVATELGEDESSSMGRQWTPAAVSDVLRNQLYIGEYSVGEVSRSEPAYRIVSEEVFQEATSVRTRFQSSETHSREPMHDRLKKAQVNAILDQYCNWIHER